MKSCRGDPLGRPVSSFEFLVAQASGLWKMVISSRSQASVWEPELK